jgi:hypothetical protein
MVWEMKYFRRRKDTEAQEEAFSTLERNLEEHLVPVEVDDAFRNSLGKRLVAVARHRDEGNGVVLAKSGVSRKVVLETVAVVGSLFSAAGLAALLLHFHRERSSMPLR